jgi:hypothetical protein
VPSPWGVTDASDWDVAGEETQGITPHPWLRSEARDRTWLFKETVVVADRLFREDLVEKMASEVAVLLGVPAAVVELAVRGDVRGCLVQDLRWAGGSDQPGQVLLGGIVEDYDPEDRGHRGHSIPNIYTALEGYAAPPGSATPEEFAAFDVFAGYLLFDALIANSDRHDRNWAVLVRPPGEQGLDALCGSYDHASSLGFNLSDDQRAARMRDGTVDSWVRGGKARQFERVPEQPVQTLVELAESALQICSSDVMGYWYDALRNLQPDAIRAVVDDAPELSGVTRNFTAQIITLNQRRLIDVF